MDGAPAAVMSRDVEAVVAERLHHLDLVLVAQARRYTRFAVLLNSAALSEAEKLADRRLNAFHTTA